MLNCCHDVPISPQTRGADSRPSELSVTAHFNVINGTSALPSHHDVKDWHQIGSYLGMLSPACMHYLARIALPKCMVVYTPKNNNRDCGRTV